MSKLTVLVAGAAGYVLGARAGRGRYEQIRSVAAKVWGNPTVQSKVSVLEDKAADAAKAAAGLASEKASNVAGSVVGKVRHRAEPSEPAGDTVVVDEQTAAEIRPS
ncbi:hypothetical protein NUM3379_42110 [Kineococcus sp. NUM-3379]